VSDYERFGRQPPIRVGKVPFEVTTMTDAIERVLVASQQAEAIPIRLANAYCVALASKELEYEQLVNGPGLNYPDGMPIVWFMNRKQAISVACRVRGPSFFKSTIDIGRRAAIRHYFLGTTPDTLHYLVLSLQREFPGVRISGSFSPPMAPVDNACYAQWAQRVLQTDAQLVWVALVSRVVSLLLVG